MHLEVGKAYRDRIGNIWDCLELYAHEGAWCRNRSDKLKGLFTISGYYMFDGTDFEYDLIEEV